MIPLMLLNCEKILHTGNVTTYQQTLFPDLSNQKFIVVKRTLKETF